MLDIWNLLRGKKTYLLSLTCIGSVLLKALSDHAEGQTIDWSMVVQHVLACLATMALRHGIANGK
jgi:hypothetical protein